MIRLLTYEGLHVHTFVILPTNPCNLSFLTQFLIPTFPFYYLVPHRDLTVRAGLSGTGRRRRGRGHWGRSSAHSSHGNNTTTPGTLVLDGAGSTAGTTSSAAASAVGGVSVIVAGDNNVEEKPARKKVYVCSHVLYMYIHVHEQSCTCTCT